MSDALALLAALVAIPSLSGDEKRVADAVEQFALGQGFATQREGSNVWFTMGDVGGPRLLLHSHLDTVPPSAGWQGDPWRPHMENNRLVGLGANDAKGCVAALLCAASTLRREAQSWPGSVLVALTAEEETGGPGGITSVANHWGKLAAAVFGEPTGLAPCTAQGGMLRLACTARGDTGHVAHAGALGLTNAIHLAAIDIERLARLEFEPYLAMDGVEVRCQAQVSQISGGVSANQLPGVCEFQVDIRTTPNLQHRLVLEQIRATLGSEVCCQSQRYQPVASPPGTRVARAAIVASEQPPYYSRTVSDWSLLSGVPAVKIGPGESERSHQPQEFIYEHELLAGVELYRRLVHEYFAGAQDG